MYHILDHLINFPDPTSGDEHGIVALGGDLSVDRLLLAYRMGIFPWYSEGEPIIWFSPDPRLILYPGKLKISKSLRQVIKLNKYHYKINHAFAAVIQNCAMISRKGEVGTWITDDMMQAYIRLHQAGHAHSFEVYNEERLVGGLYGIIQGKAFFGESMFHLESNASKLALYYLVQWCKQHSFHFIDAQVPTDHMISMGAKIVTRDVFLKILQKAI
jgi:leucyl/phenylalanyl-tRNA--protein transferase